MLKRPILITGIHNSGSTWLGRMIALSKEVGYIHEPFNINNKFNPCLGRLKYWYTYINENNEKDFYECIKKNLKYKKNIIRPLVSIGNISDLKYYFRYEGELMFSKISNRRPLFKDPIALFSVDWLERKFNFIPIILIRHPAAFIASIKKRNWKHPFSHFVMQDELINGSLIKYKYDIMEFARNEYSIVEQGILLWNIIYSQVLEYQNKHHEWSFIKYENLANNPIEELSEIYNYLELDYTNEIQEKIKIYTGLSQNKTLLYKKMIRNSSSNIFYWKNYLSEEEIDEIFSGVKEISSNFYSDEEW